MEAIELISQDIFDKVRSRFSNLEMGDENGNVTSDPRAARFFDFDFVVEDHTLGRVSISINERGALKIFYGRGILEGQTQFVEDVWFNFLKEMRRFAKRRLLRFDTRDITKSNLNKNDFQYLASQGTKEEPMAENKMFGSAKSSYLPLEKTRLVIRHSKPVDETQRGARSRNINAMYIENADGERFKYPFIHLAGAKAMQRHVANGGRPYDDAGKAIIKMSEQIAQLSSLKRHVGRDSMQSEANEIMDRACAKLESLKGLVNSISKQGHYQQWKDGLQITPDDEIVLDQATMENYKSKFTVSTFAEDLAQYFPLIHSIMQEAGEIDLESYVKKEEKCVGEGCPCDDEEDEELEEIKKTDEEFAKFEAWANSVVESALSDDLLADLKKLVDSGLTLGVDGVDAIEALKNIGITDPDLLKTLEQFAKLNPDADPAPIIDAWLKNQTEETPATDEEPAEEEPATESFDEPAKLDIRKIAEMVKSFYDRETGKFPLGETGVITKVKKEFGDRAAAIAEKFVNELSSNAMEHDAIESPFDNDIESEKTFEDILKLAGLK